MDYTYDYHCVKSVGIQSYSGPQFPAFELNTDRYPVSLHIQSESEKMGTRITPNTNTSHSVYNISMHNTGKESLSLTHNHFP